jgi:hypothetical protein
MLCSKFGATRIVTGSRFKRFQPFPPPLRHLPAYSSFYSPPIKQSHLNLRRSLDFGEVFPIAEDLACHGRGVEELHVLGSGFISKLQFRKNTLVIFNGPPLYTI